MSRQPVPYFLHLSKDKKFARLLQTRGDTMVLSKRRDIFLYLCFSILSQQLSTKVASVIRQRFLKLYTGKPTPDQLLGTSHETLRSIGLSNAKARYVHNVARYAIEPGLSHKQLGKMNNEEVIDYLTKIKGVGKWTAEMMLMFTLGREDVFAVDDLGIQQAMISLYKLDKTNKKKLREEMLRISANWSPYRSFACLHLWQHKDNKPDAS